MLPVDFNARPAASNSTSPLAGSSSAQAGGTAPTGSPALGIHQVSDRSSAFGTGLYGAYSATNPSAAGQPSIWGAMIAEAKNLWAKARSMLSLSATGAGSTSSAEGSAAGAHHGSSASTASGRSDSSASATLPPRVAHWIARQKAKIAAATATAQRQDLQWDNPTFDHSQILQISAAVKQQEANALVPLTDDQQVVYGTLSADAQAAYKQLTGEQRDQFDSIYRAVGGLWSEPTQASLKSSAGLQEILANGVILDQDKEQNTMLSDLASRVGQPLASQLDGKDVDSEGQLQNIVNDVAYPDQIFQGTNTDVCASAALQTLMANNDPAELVRVATGLVFDGKVTLHGTDQSGDVMHLQTGELWTVDGGRSSTSQLIQGSFDHYALQFEANPLGGEDDGAAGGRSGMAGGAGGGRSGLAGGVGGGRMGFGGGVGGGRSGFAGGVGGGRSGLAGGVGNGSFAQAGTAGTGSGEGSVSQGFAVTEFQAENLYEHVDGDMAVPVKVVDQNRDAAWKGAIDSLQNGYPLPSMVTGYGPDGKVVGLHQITLLDVSPDGKQIKIQDSSVGKAMWVPIDRVKAAVQAMVIPAQYAGGTGWQIVANPENPGDADAKSVGGGRGGIGGGQG